MLDDSSGHPALQVNCDTATSDARPTAKPTSSAPRLSPRLHHRCCGQVLLSFGHWPHRGNGFTPAKISTVSHIDAFHPVGRVCVLPRFGGRELNQSRSPTATFAPTTVLLPPPPGSQRDHHASTTPSRSHGHRAPTPPVVTFATTPFSFARWPTMLQCCSSGWRQRRAVAVALSRLPRRGDDYAPARPAAASSFGVGSAPR